jgi:hypothetical protein
LLVIVSCGNPDAGEAMSLKFLAGAASGSSWATAIFCKQKAAAVAVAKTAGIQNLFFMT